MTETWYPAASQRPGPPSKQGYPGYPNRNAIAGVVLHSMDGFYATGGLNMLDNSGQSWHFSILLDGSVVQHYPLEAQCYQAGIASINRRTIGIEHEGVHSFRLDPLTEPQIQASVALCNWIAGLPSAFALVRGDTLFLHKDLGTSECPGVRFDGVLDRWLGAPPSLYPVPDVTWQQEGWAAVADAPWAHNYPLRARTVRPGANIQLLRDGRSPDGYEEFHLRIEDYEGE